MFLLLESSHAGKHLVEIHFVAVELGAIDADEARLAADGDAAGTTHSRSIHHDGVQGHVGADIIFLGQQAAELHHDGRTDGKHLIHLLALDHLLDTHGHDTLLTIRTIVGHDDNLIRVLAHLVLQDNQILRAACEHADDAVAGSLQRLDDRQHRGHSYPTPGTDHGAEILDMSSLAQRAYDVRQFIAHIQVAELRGAHAHLLHDEGDGASLRVSISNGQRHALTLLAHADDDEVTGTTSLGDEGSLDHQFIHFL